MNPPEKLPVIWMGLGNPGTEYIKSRHNAGYRAIDYILKTFGGEFDGNLRNGKVWRSTIGGKFVVIVKPNTYMNLSGKAARWILMKEGVSVDNLVVLHDDMDLDLGRIKIKWKGGDAGHKGIRSIIRYLQTDKFFRIRIGIGKPTDGKGGSDYVLSDFTPDEEVKISRVLPHIAVGMEIWADKGTNYAFNYLNRKD